MKSLAIRTATIFIAVFFVLYVGYQAIRYFNEPYQTEVVFRTSVEESIRVDGVAIRSESVLESTSYSGVDYAYENGERVKKNAKIADFYSTAEEIKIRNNIEKLNSAVSMLKEAQEEKDSYFADAEVLNKQIANDLVEYLNVCDSGFTEGLDKYKNELLLSLNKRLNRTDENADFSERINSLSTLIKAEEAKCTSSLGAVYTKNAGYFVNFADGLESVLTKEGIENMDASQLLSYIGKEEPENTQAVGKVITQSEWYFAVAVDQENAEKFYRGRNVDIYFPFSETEIVDASVYKVILDEASKKSVAILKTDSMSKNLAQMRNCTVQISFKTITGLRLNKNAVRFNENNEQGVYVKNGTQILFKKINIIHEEEGYYLTQYNETDAEFLRLYDDVVIDGRDLYDKKTIN